MKKLLRAIVELNWSVIGAGFVIVTLTGSVKDTAVLLTVAGVMIQLTGILLDKGDKEE